LPQDLQCQIRDYSGHLITVAKMQRSSDSKKYQLHVQLPSGYYEIDVIDLKQRIGLISLTPYQRNIDDFYGLETLIARKDSVRIKAILALLTRSGIRHIREFHSWKWEERREGEWSENTEKIYKLAFLAGIKVTFFLIEPPDWIKTAAPRQRFATELLKLDGTIKAILLRRGFAMDGLQIDNEPEGNNPGDAVMASILAASWFMTEHHAGIPLVGPGFAGWNNNSELIRPYLENGYLDNIDIFAFHTYKSPETAVDDIAFYRELMSNHPKSGLPIWITESGKPWPRGSNSDMVGKTRPYFLEDLASARDITMKGVEFKAAGAARYYPFSYQFFTENDNNFGMRDYYESPLRSLAGYFYSITALGGKQYIGDLKTNPENVKISRIFSDGNDNVAVLYTGNLRAHTIDLAKVPVKAVTGIDGRMIPISAEKKITIFGGMCYVWLAEVNMQDLLNSNTSAMKYLKQAKSYQFIPRRPNPVIYRYQNWRRDQKDRYFYFGSPEKLAFTIFNFSNRVETTLPSVILPAGGIAENLPKPISLAPRSAVETELSLDTDKCEIPEQAVRLIDKLQVASPLYLPFIDIDRLKVASFNLNDWRKWSKNSNGTMTISYDEQSKAICFRVTFGIYGGWIFPCYVLQLPQENLGRVMAVSFDIRANKTDGTPASLNCPGVMLRLRDNTTKLAFIRPTPTEKWSRCVVFLPPEMQAKDALEFRIGMVCYSQTLEYMVRNIKLYIRE